VTRPAERDLARLDPPVRRQVATAIDRLALDPTGPGSVALVGREGRRLRVRGWRDLYRHDNETRTVTVLRVLPRGRAYDR